MLRFFDDIVIVTFWERLDKEIDKARSSRSGIARALGLNPNALTLWAKRQTYPAANISVRLAREFGVTVEYLVNGEVAAGWLPPKIKIIVDDLMVLEDDQLITVTKMVHPLAEEVRAAAVGGG